MKVLVLLTLLSLTCEPTFETKPEQALVTAIVWNQAYKMTVTPPRVEWIDASKLTCANGTGFKTDYTENGINTIGCVGGVTYIDLWLATVAWPVGARYSTTSFVHEYCHAFMSISTGDSDPDHKGPCFVPGGYVDRVNTLLDKDGL